MFGTWLCHNDAIKETARVILANTDLNSYSIDTPCCATFCDTFIWTVSPSMVSKTDVSTNLNARATKRQHENVEAQPKINAKTHIVLVSVSPLLTVICIVSDDLKKVPLLTVFMSM